LSVSNVYTLASYPEIFGLNRHKAFFFKKKGQKRRKKNSKVDSVVKLFGR
jgi:hypothetical protein